MHRVSGGRCSILPFRLSFCGCGEIDGLSNDDRHHLHSTRAASLLSESCDDDRRRHDHGDDVLRERRRADTPVSPVPEHFGLTPALVTVIFAAYVLSLLLALLTTGALSDHVGRRPTVLGALMMNIIAMVMFITARSGAALITARAVQGFATGVATAALGAAILDVDQRRGAVLNSVTVFAGLTVGTLGAATLVTFAPDPAQLVYVVLLTLSGIEALLIWHMPETAQTKPGASHIAAPSCEYSPIQARQTLAQLTPVTFASWALVDSISRSCLRLCGSPQERRCRSLEGGRRCADVQRRHRYPVPADYPADRVLLGAIPALALGVAITLGGVHAQFVAVMLLGTVVSGLDWRRVLCTLPNRPAARQG